MLFSPSFRKLLTQSVIETTYRQLHLQDLVGTLPWRYNLREGTLLFGGSQDVGGQPEYAFKASILGIDDGSTFLWAALSSERVSDGRGVSSEDDDDDDFPEDDDAIPVEDDDIPGDYADIPEEEDDDLLEDDGDPPQDDDDPPDEDNDVKHSHVELSDRNEDVVVLDQACENDHKESDGNEQDHDDNDDDGDDRDNHDDRNNDSSDHNAVPQLDSNNRDETDSYDDNLEEDDPEDGDDGEFDDDNGSAHSEHHMTSAMDYIAEDEHDDSSLEEGKSQPLARVPIRLAQASQRVRRLGRELGVVEFTRAAVTTGSGAPYSLHVLTAAAAGALDAPAYFCDYPGGVALVLESDVVLPQTQVRSPPAETARIVAAVTAARTLAPDQSEALRAFVERRGGHIETRDDTHWRIFLDGALPIAVTLDQRHKLESLAPAGDT
jgi:hypothetical protein